MKKNILTIIILAAILINLTLTAVTLFVVIPNAKKTDSMVTKILTIIDLELESKNAGEKVVSINDIGTFQVVEDMTINLKKTANDKVAHYAVVNCTVKYNEKSKDYTKKKPLLAEQESIIKEIVQDEVSKYSFEDIIENKENIKIAIREKLNTTFETDFILGVSFSTFIVQ